MLTREQEIQKAVANGDKKVAKWEGGVRSLDLQTFEKGDTFTIPENPDIYETKVGDRKVQYIFVEVQNGAFKKFYPSTLTKSRQPYDENLMPVGNRIHTTGTAASAFQNSGTVEEGMNKLANKKLVISDIQIIRSMRFDRPELQNVQIPVIDFAD